MNPIDAYLDEQLQNRLKKIGIPRTLPEARAVAGRGHWVVDLVEDVWTAICAPPPFWDRKPFSWNVASLDEEWRLICLRQIIKTITARHTYDRTISDLLLQLVKTDAPLSKILGFAAAADLSEENLEVFVRKLGVTLAARKARPHRDRFTKTLLLAWEGFDGFRVADYRCLPPLKHWAGPAACALIAHLLDDRGLIYTTYAKRVERLLFLAPEEPILVTKAGVDKAAQVFAVTFSDAGKKWLADTERVKKCRSRDSRQGDLMALDAPTSAARFRDADHRAPASRGRARRLPA